jgi:hypothetical protein
MGETPGGIVVTIHDVDIEHVTVDELTRNVGLLKPSAVWVDTGGVQGFLLEALRKAGVHAHALPKPLDALDQHELRIRLANNRGIVQSLEALLRDGSIADERKRKDLLFDIEALRARL